MVPHTSPHVELGGHDREARRRHCQNHYEVVGCTPGPLVTLSPTLSDFQIYHQIRFFRFSLGDPNNRITEFGNSGEFG
jgi:hypothetical protein